MNEPQERGEDMKKFKRYVIRRIDNNNAVGTIVVEIGKRKPKPGGGLKIAEAIGYFEIETKKRGEE